ncbi:hypothetical protein [Actinotalea fermentans]|uniref:Uncharacterized protein n=1 Tax=Actinotalea fermentans TaxID=43671 RepID=A0A511YXT6_9CELL|nr:hypothetical protein [Actinotalea fermentans]GEN79946.1 hypothetical protein AFE02nite_16800 [Actinotalea fermentans]
MRTTPAPARLLRDTAVAALTGLALGVAGLVALAVPAAAAQETCPDTGGDWIKEDGVADGTYTLTVAAPSKMVIVETCVKAANDVAFATYSPGENVVTVTSPATNDAGAQQSISHVSYRLEMVPMTPGVCAPDLTGCAPETPAPETPAPATPAPETPAPAVPVTPPAPSRPSTPSAPVAEAPAQPETPAVQSPAPQVPAQPIVGVVTAPAPVHHAAAPLAPAETTALAAPGPRGLAVTGADAWVVLAAALLAALGAGAVALRRRLGQDAA